MRKSLFENKIQPLLQYIGAIGAILMTIVYFIIVVVLIQGFALVQTTQAILFPVVTAGVGFVIMQFLKVQGVAFAKELPENKRIADEYYKTKTKDKKARPIGFYWIISIIKDVLFRCATVAFITGGLIYIVIAGSQDYMLLLLAAANLVMFICFGLLALSSSYNYYNEHHVSYMQERLKEAREASKEVKDDKNR